MADPDLQIRGEGGGHLDPEIRGALVSKKFFSALWASVWSKSKGGGRPPDPSPGYATVSYYTKQLFVSARKAVRHQTFATTFTTSEKREIPIDYFLN